MADDNKYEFTSKEVRYAWRTHWERETLYANGFKIDPDDDTVMVAKRNEGTEYAARTIANGGIG